MCTEILVGIAGLRLMTGCRLEWAGRLVIEPRRLWRRYLVAAVVAGSLKVLSKALK